MRKSEGKMGRGRRRNHPLQPRQLMRVWGKKKQKEEKKKETGSAPSIQLPGLFGRLLRPTWIIRWAYSETPLPTGGI